MRLLLARLPMRYSIAQLAAPLLQEEDASAPAAVRVRTAGRLMTLLENEPHRLPELYRAVADAGATPDRLQPAMLVGITGAPGSGKSTLTDALVAGYRQKFPNRRVGVVAVDPSSPFTGGAVLGDRVRMMRHATDPMVFVRSLASRGRLGGLSLGVKGVIRAMALAGCDLVLLETVGVGQSEVEVVRVADFTMVVLAPGQGDSVQMLKAGLMEAGDAFVVNKADRDGASTLYAQLVSTLQMGVDVRAHSPQKAPGGTSLPIGTCHDDAHRGHAGIDPADLADLGLQARKGVEVFLVAAQDGTGVDTLLESIESRRQEQASTWAARRDRALHEEVREAILEAGRDRLARTLGANGSVSDAVARLMQGEASVADLADELLKETAAAARPDAANPPTN